MRGKSSLFFALFVTVISIVFAVNPFHLANAAEPVVIGVPTSLGFLEGFESVNAMTLAIEEINAKGGVTVGGVQRPFKIEKIDLRDAAPGVPVPEALLGLEKIILEKKPHAIVVGPFRSEALLAGMDIIAKHKVPMLGTIAMSPASETKVIEDREKYKYVFRVCLNAKHLIQYLAGTMALLKKEFEFDKVFVMHQDVAWARATAGLMKKVYFDKAGWTVVGQEAYPTGSGDYSSGLMKVRQGGAQVILPIFDMPQSGILVRQWGQMQVPAILAGFVSPLAGPEAWSMFYKKIDGAMNAIFEVGNVPTKQVPKSREFWRSYKKRWGREIQSGHGPAPSYDAVYVLAEAIERAGSLDADALVAALEKTDRMGAIGRIRFDEGHQVTFGTDPNEAAIGAVIQWRKGKRVIVFPDSLAEKKVSLPAWM
ncbi:MAG: ABC transporter substrate-binding protein [Proteobacteria bacterium]|nr:ABC transporter substrate-binding protein [Pseudomonadota bacterium]